MLNPLPSAHDSLVEPFERRGIVGQSEQAQSCSQWRDPMALNDDEWITDSTGGCYLDEIALRLLIH